MDKASIITNNQKGRTSTIPNEVSEQFIEFASNCSKPVLDLGAAFGVATIPALERGAQVVANDIDPQHLVVLEQSAPIATKSRLILVGGAFPKDLNFPEESFGAVHASNLLNFLTGEEIRIGLRMIFEWLAPGGKLFVIAGTPYAKNIFRFSSEYDQRVRNGDRWPGEVSQIQSFGDDPTLAELPDFLHLLDDKVLVREAALAGFLVDWVEMFKRKNLPSYLAMDGRENVGLICSKPFASSR